MHLSTASGVLSPSDESFDKFPFYAQRGVREMIAADKIEQVVELSASLSDAPAVPADASNEFRIAMDELHNPINWP